MKFRSQLFIVTVVFLMAFAFNTTLNDCRTAFAETVSGKQATKPVTALVTFVEIGAAKCIPCKMMQPIMKEVGEEYKGQVKVVFHDVWTQQGKLDAEKYNIRVIPTQVFLDKAGSEYFRHEGYFPKEGVVEVLKKGGVK